MTKFNEVKRIRDRLKMTQKEFGALCGLSQGAITNYERGRRIIEVSKAKHIVELAKSNGISTSLDKIYRHVSTNRSLASRNDPPRA